MTLYGITLYEMILYFIGYVLVVVLLYGLLKNTRYEYFSKDFDPDKLSSMGYDDIWEIAVMINALAVFTGLIILAFQVLVKGRSLGFCYKMPKELCMKQK